MWSRSGESVGKGHLGFLSLTLFCADKRCCKQTQPTELLSNSSAKGRQINIVKLVCVGPLVSKLTVLWRIRLDPLKCE